MRYLLHLLIYSLIYTGNVAISQNIGEAKKAILRLKSDSLSDKEKFEQTRLVAHNHPNLTIALEYSRKSLKIAIGLNDLSLQAKAWEELSQNERLLGNNQASLDASLNALKLFEQKQDSISAAAIFVQIGANMIVDEQHGQAVDYLKLALDIYESSPNKTNFGLTMINLGEAYRLSNQLDSAEIWFKNALIVNEQLEKPILEGYARGNLGMALRSKGELDQAKSELIRANEILTELGDPYSVSVYTADLAQISIAEGKATLAEQQLLEAYHMVKEEGLKEQVRDFSEMLVSFYEDRDNYALALKYQKVYQVYQDSLVNKENVQQIERLKANYEIDKREREIGLLEQLTESQQIFNLALGGGLLIFGILSAMLYQSNKQKREANAMLGKQQVIVEKREEEKAILLKELNHRVKNNLQMVSSLLSLQQNQLGDHPAAEALNAGKMRVEALSMIHQKLYQDDVHTSIRIKEHLDLLVSNLMYSYGDPFEPVIIVQPEAMEIDIDTAIPLSLIVNELVTNAMKYAYEGIESPAMKIFLEQPDERYRLEFSDNGVGIDHEKDTSNSFGIRLIKSLVAQLNGTLEISDIPTGGTLWTIFLNHQEE